MLKSKELLAAKVRLEASARSKLAEITSDTNAVDAKRIEDEHAAILTEIAATDVKYRAACDDEDSDKRKRKDGAEEEGDDADDDDDDDGGADPKRNLPRSVMAEMVLIDTQARGLGVELKLADAITRGEKPDDMRKRLFAELAKKSGTRGPRASGAPDVEIVRDEREGRAAAMQVALTTRMLSCNNGIAYNPLNLREKAFVDQHRKQSEQYMGMGIIDIAAACIDYRGRGSYLTARDTDEILTRAFNSTSDFPAIFQNVLNKSLLARYELMAPTYRMLAVQRSFQDFRPHPQIRAGEFPTLQPVTQTGEIIYGTSADNYENVSVLPYGIIFSISRQMLVNDDLGAIDQILGSAGDTVSIFENTTFFNMFLTASGAGPTLTQDSTAVFASGHGNLAASGTAITVVDVGKARAALMKMKSISGNFINVPPSFLLTGPDKQTEADQIITNITPALITSANPFMGKLQTITDSNITGNAWYIGTTPSRVSNFVYGFLNGATGPRTRTFEPFGVQGVKISLEHDFGVGAIDYRGMYRNPGA